MSVFGSIMSKIFGHDASSAAAQKSAAQASWAQPASAEPAPAQPAPAGSQTASASPSAPATGAKPPGSVDVEAILKDLAAKSGRPSNWRVSIVDLLTLLGLPCKLSDLKELAKELGYKGDTNDSYTMNVWLHKQVMTKLAENGGKVPDDLKHA